MWRAQTVPSASDHSTGGAASGTATATATNVTAAEGSTSGNCADLESNRQQQQQQQQEQEQQQQQSHYGSRRRQDLQVNRRGSGSTVIDFLKRGEWEEREFSAKGKRKL